jgi:hypothetical protein
VRQAEEGRKDGEKYGEKCGEKSPSLRFARSDDSEPFEVEPAGHASRSGGSSSGARRHFTFKVRTWRDAGGQHLSQHLSVHLASKGGRGCEPSPGV